MLSNGQTKSSEGYVSLPLNDLKLLTQAADVGHDVAIQNVQLKSMLTVKEKAIQSQKELIGKQSRQITSLKQALLYFAIVLILFGTALYYLYRKKKTT